MKLADTSLLQAFVAVAEAGSFIDGARQVGLTRSAVGKAVSRLEDVIGARLLHRTTRHIGLTAEGKAFHERAVQILNDLEDAQAAAMWGRAQPRGILRVTVTEAYGRQILLPVLAEFLERWPDLMVEASFTDRVVDLVQEGCDVAIRFGPVQTSSELVARVVARSAGHL